MAGPQVQTATCKRDRRLSKRYQSLGHSFNFCFVCEGGKPSEFSSDSESCRFVGFRRVEFTEGPPQVSFHSNEVVVTCPQIPQCFNRPFTFDVLQEQMSVCAQVLLPILQRERVHIQQPGLIRRSREVEYRVLCDVCASSLFAESWFCATCGREICNPCKELSTSITGPCVGHGTVNLLPLTRFQESELDRAIAAMSTFPVHTPMPQNDTPSLVRTAPVTISAKHLNYALFKRTWTRSEPVVVTDLLHALQGPWGPDYFKQTMGHQSVTVVDCESNEEFKSTVFDFFETFGSAVPPKRTLKIKDWPPQSDFRQMFPELYMAFIHGVPFPDHTRPDGVRNLVSHFAKNGIIPDLGPKMYNANGSLDINTCHGSTRLHLDVTSAVNIMLYSAERTDGLPGGAIWHIFPLAAQPILRDFIRSEPAFGFEEPGDPIHNHTIYLTPALLQLLFDKHNVRPFTIHQRPGVAVFIPAGCAHQVCNITDSIKIACDFLDAEGVLASGRLGPQFRAQRLSHNWLEDVLQFEITLWHAWTSLSRQKDQATVSLLDTKPMAAATATATATATARHSETKVGSNMGLPICLADGLELSKQDRKKEKRRLFRKRIADVQRSQKKPGHDYQCPLCPQPYYFNKHGLLHHLGTSHGISVHAPSIPLYVKLQEDEFMRLVQAWVPQNLV